MQIERLDISNYKSLRNVSVELEGLSVLVGPNGAGKSNFCDALDFLGRVYRHGLEMAIAQKGGYENIAFRRARRATGDISFQIDVRFEPGETVLFFGLLHSKRITEMERASYRIRHRFSLRSRGQGIGAPFRVSEEKLRVEVIAGENAGECFELDRAEPEGLVLRVEQPGLASESLREVFEQSGRGLGQPIPLSQQALFAVELPYGFLLLGNPSRQLGNIAVHQFSPAAGRRPGVPTPNPELSRHGDNLPALVDWLKTHRSQQWKTVLSAMKDIIPGLQDISVQYLHTKTMGLFFEEEGVGRPWLADEVSDGTIQALAVLVAMADPRNAALIIEEPESSVHPWMVREMVGLLREAAREKTVVLTTHSPFLIDCLHPHEIWVVSRSKGATHVRRLTDIDHDVQGEWERGEVKLSEYLDAGLVPGAAPEASC